MPSIKPSSQSNTQMVMANGSQTSNPAMMYFLTRCTLLSVETLQSLASPQLPVGAAALLLGAAGALGAAALLGVASEGLLSTDAGLSALD